jgi:methionyl-tRNA formyltransferase
MDKGAKLVLRTVEQIRDETFNLTVQDDKGEMKHAPKLFKEDCKIDWSKNSKEIYNFVRGLSPYPAAWAIFNGKTFKIFEVGLTDQDMVGQPGTIQINGKEGILIKTGDGAVTILDLQQQGKNRMKTTDFLRGNTI